MRILAVSDLHYRLRQYDWLVEASDDFDVVALAGDLADVVNAVPHEVQTVVVANYLVALADHAIVLVASGNHDLDGPGAHGEQTAGWLRRSDQASVHVDGASVDVGDTRFTVCPWWDGPITRAEVDRQLAAAAVDRPARWVWLYHAPPAGTPLCNDGRRTFPDHDLAEWIALHRPDIVLCGHIHQAPWAADGSWHARLGDTWVFNAGKQIGPVPSHITLDTDAASATWFGIGESEALSLV
jgi:Icc-related predicted phosphoesterase